MFVILELSNPWAKVIPFKVIFVYGKKYQSNFDISKLYILKLWKSLVFNFSVFLHMLWQFSQHDEKTKKIGKQIGMKERE
jgi:hypothetical protein